MIFAIKTVRTPIVDSFVDRFRNPKNISMALIHASIYVENKVDWVDGLLVFRQKSIVDGFAKFGIIASVGLMLLSFFVHSSLMLWLGLLFAIFGMCIISPIVRFMSIALKLFFMGHRKKIGLVSNTLLIEALFFKLEVHDGKDEG